jgi:hypothetical protein
MLLHRLFNPQSQHQPERFTFCFTDALMHRAPANAASSENGSETMTGVSAEAASAAQGKVRFI